MYYTTLLHYVNYVLQCTVARINYVLQYITTYIVSKVK